MLRIGMDIGGSHIACGIFTETGEMLCKVEKEINRYETSQNLKRVLISEIDTLINLGSIEISQVQKIGIGYPGLVLGDTLGPGNVNLKDEKLKVELQQRYQKEVLIDNDVNCATIGEFLFGALQDCRNGIMLTSGTGIGGGIIIDRQLYRGSQGMGAELGNMICINKKTIGYYCAISSLKKRIKQVMNIEEITGEKLVEILENKEVYFQPGQYKKVEMILEDFIEAFAIGIYNYIKIFNPEKVILGGSFVYYEKVFLEKIKQHKLMNELRKENMLVNIKIAILGNDAGIVGAAFQDKIKIIGS